MSTLLATAFLFLILSSPPGLGVDGNFSACVAATMRPVNSKQREHVKLRSYPRPKHRFVSSRDISGCKPRVFRPPPSAPSRRRRWSVFLWQNWKDSGTLLAWSWWVRVVSFKGKIDPSSFRTLSVRSASHRSESTPKLQIHQAARLLKRRLRDPSVDSREGK
uniref:Uncharacterized protein LOC114914630 n=1 Tax=Elaeis guineensis var. tenera TaxID=51953 RepID=A0A8N4F9K9_ELAGV|nr:uncharacterized protein LOC114914630 [Elaeis guineensis]